MRILLTGASGMLAAEVVPELKRLKHDVLEFDLNQRLPSVSKLDITDQSAVRDAISKAKPDFVFHLAAETDVDRCEREPEYAFRVNTFGTENVALACQEFDIPMLYVSTAGVFYGDQFTPYTEFDIPNPKNIYGHSKWQGEIIVRNLLSRYFIFRPGWMVGGWEIDKKFVYKIVTQLKEGKAELKVVSDKFGSPTFTKDFAKILPSIVESRRYGLYHLTNQGTCSRHEVAVKIVEFMGLKSKVAVLPINSAQFPLSAPRADSEMMRNYKLDILGLNSMPHWEKSLEEYVKANKDTYTQTQ